MVEINGLTVQYVTKDQKVTALEDLNISLEGGETATFLGPSGCGKTTLLHVVAGIVKPYAGTVEINGETVLPDAFRIGFIPQNYGLLPWKTVYENIMLGATIKRMKKDEDYAGFLLEALGLSGLKKRYPRELSGGQRQRAAIARAFVLRPEILLMDEPFSALDAITREEVQDLFLELWRIDRIPTLFVTHSIEEAVYIGKKIVLMSPSPGRVADVVDNPLFGTPGLRSDKRFYELELAVRARIESGWRL